MLFTSPVFLFLFLPGLLVAYHLAPHRARNGLLLAASLGFYAWGEGRLVALLLASIAGNAWVASSLARAQTARARTCRVTLAVLGNLGALAWFKYSAFLRDLLAPSASLLGLALPEVVAGGLPLGISFYTFQALSYVLDVGRGTAAAQGRLRGVALYVALFPQLVAGPIVRYRELAGQLGRREVDAGDLAAGARRFILGLAKKVLVADQLAPAAEAAFRVGAGALGPGAAWVGLLAYTLQIYFDFSGYSDMAIGLGRLFGFRFPENFRAPYLAGSVRDFWRRWHITLSRWFRDYLYIPLGGSRRPPRTTARNLLVVFTLCGLWHGASWNFVLWGLWHGAFLALERHPKVAPERLPRPLRHGYVLLVVGLGWVLFRASDLPHALRYLGALVGASPWHRPGPTGLALLDPRTVLALAAGLLACTPQAAAAEARTPGARTLRDLGLLALLALALLQVGATTHRPFLYFRF